MPTHYPLEGGCYIVKENVIICTKAEAEEAEASIILPETEQKSTDPQLQQQKRKGK